MTRLSGYSCCGITSSLRETRTLTYSHKCLVIDVAGECISDISFKGCLLILQLSVDDWSCYQSTPILQELLHASI